MEVQRVFFLCLLNPLEVEPVERVLRVAVKPQLGTRHRTARNRLLDEGTGHQGDLVAQHPSQRHPLDERRAPLVLAAEQVKTIALSA